MQCSEPLVCTLCPPGPQAATAASISDSSSSTSTSSSSCSSLSSLSSSSSSSSSSATSSSHFSSRSLSEWRAHVQSPDHIVLVRKRCITPTRNRDLDRGLSLSRGQGPESDAHPSSSSSSPSLSPLSSSSSSSSSRSSSSLPSAAVRSQFFRCSLCSIVLGSSSTVPHLTGKKHFVAMRNQQLVQLPQSGSQGDNDDDPVSVLFLLSFDPFSFFLFFFSLLFPSSLFSTSSSLFLCLPVYLLLGSCRPLCVHVALFWTDTFLFRCLSSSPCFDHLCSSYSFVILLVCLFVCLFVFSFSFSAYRRGCLKASH